MSALPDFDKARYGCVHVDFDTRLLHVGERSLLLSDRAGNLGNVHVVAAFITAANREPSRLSLQEIAEISLAKSENSFKARFSKLRERLGKFDIANGVTANALFLSDRLTGNQSSSTSDCVTKLPYHFNTALADMIATNGHVLSAQNKRGVRLEPSLVLGPKSHPEEYRSALGLPPL
jgi:hypothetical protein